MPGALDGVRVLDFTHRLNGPFCTMLLGHLGAEVIKIEPPTGDAFRRNWMPKDAQADGYEFLMVNTNKKSVVLDLKTERGLELARRLVASSDVLVENFLEGTMAKFGLDYEHARELNPRLIYAFSRGFGSWGPYSKNSSNAGLNNAMTGWTDAAWKHSGRPGTKAMGIGDEAGGISLAVGILAALYAREQTGVGQKIEVSMQEALLGFMVSTLHEHFTGNHVGGGAVKVADGYFTLRAPDLSDEAWGQLARLMDREDLLVDARFASPPSRRENSRALNEIVVEWAGSRTRHELWEQLRPIGYFGGPVLSVGEVLEDPHIREREVFMTREHPTAGSLTLLAPWIRMSETPTSIRRVSPMLGQDTEEVLHALD
jgi:crotonobetainyl-CoA:carnitine CoA-transferase CaiB-like acyl-CoA transferase